jgi:diadenosine tetraphosphate (Ap4A) HIT family hydrolase
MTLACPFCSLDPTRILYETGLAVAYRDAFPVSRGHCLVIPRRHIASWFDATPDERRDLLGLLDEARAHIQRDHKPDAFNIGINDGAAAGQTVPHLHVHLIPRYSGDVPDPRGGVRWVIPGQANYWSRAR